MMKTRMTTRSAKIATTTKATTTTTTPTSNKFSSPTVTMKSNPHIADATERLLADAAATAATSPQPQTMMGRQVRFATNVVATPVLASTRQNSAQVSTYQTTDTLDNLIGQMQGMAIQDRKTEEQGRQRIKKNQTTADHHRSAAAISATLPKSIIISSSGPTQLSPSRYVPFGKRAATPIEAAKEEKERRGRGGRRLNSPSATTTRVQMTLSSPPVLLSDPEQAFYETVVHSKKTGAAVTVKRSTRFI